MYNVSEDVGMVELCAVVYAPDENEVCPIMFSFEVMLSTADNSAGIGVTFSAWLV